MATITVHNLASRDETLVYSGNGMTPAKAVAAAFAQSIGDWNTTGYAKKYLPLVQTGKVSVSLGDFAAKR